MRIVKGIWAGEELASPGKRVRATSEHVRDLWLSYLEPHLGDARVLDLFSGSGALGLEALSVIPEEYLIPAGITAAIGDGALALIILSALGSILKSARELGVMPAAQKPSHEGDVA